MKPNIELVTAAICFVTAIFGLVTTLIPKISVRRNNLKFEFKEIQDKSIKLFNETACYFTNPRSHNEGGKEKYDEVSEKLNELAGEIKVFIQHMNKVNFGVPSVEELNEAYKILIGLSNSCSVNEKQLQFYVEKNYERYEKIQKILRLK